MSNNEQQIVAEFDKCPNCGSTRRFAGEVAEEQMEKGSVGEGLKFGLQQVGGPIMDPRKISQTLVGAKVPVVTALLDVCMDCGTIYAVRLERGEAALQGVQRQPPRR